MLSLCILPSITTKVISYLLVLGQQQVIALQMQHFYFSIWMFLKIIRNTGTDFNLTINSLIGKYWTISKMFKISVFQIIVKIELKQRSLNKINTVWQAAFKADIIFSPKIFQNLSKSKFLSFMIKVNPNSENVTKSVIFVWGIFKSDVVFFFIKKYWSISVLFKIEFSQFYD